MFLFSVKGYGCIKRLNSKDQKVLNQIMLGISTEKEKLPTVKFTNVCPMMVPNSS